MRIAPDLRILGVEITSRDERLARAGASPTRSGPEGSSRNEPRLGRDQPLTHTSDRRIHGYPVLPPGRERLTPQQPDDGLARQIGERFAIACKGTLL